jgi:DNA-binding CsgD family transcriptional regulator
MSGLALVFEYDALVTRNETMTRSVKTFLRASEGANTAFLIVLLLIVLRFWRNKKGHPWRQGILVFMTTYTALFVAGYVAVFWMTQGRAFRIAYPVVVFFTHPGPLIYIYLYFRRQYHRHPRVVSRSDSVADALSRYGVSNRETEVVRLLIQGKSYRDIQENLRISMPTVKTHVSNIYRKMSIRNRWQLLRILQIVDSKPVRDPDAWVADDTTIDAGGDRGSPIDRQGRA